jgi:virulence factor Mce-like protein
VIAAIVILAGSAITFYAFDRGLPFARQFTLYAVVGNSVNVRDGSPVRIAGIDVGSVEGVSAAGDASRIQFTVGQSGLPIHKDATVRIRDRLFLEGSYYLDLDPGTPQAPVLHDGGTIPLAQTTSLVQFYQVLSSFDVATRTNLTNLVRTLDQSFSAPTGRSLTSGGAGELKAAVPYFKPVLEDTAVVSRAFQGTRPGDVGAALSGSSEVFATLALESSQLADLVSGLDRASSALASTDGALAQSVAGLDETLQVAPGALTAVDRSLPPVAALGRALDPSLRVSPPILDAVSTTASQLGSALGPGERGPLLSALRVAVEEFPALLRQLAVAFPLSKQVTDCLQTHVIPVTERQVPDGPLSTGRPAWQDFIHFLPGVAGASGSFDANGAYTRTLAGAGSNTLSATFPPIGRLTGSAPPGGSSLLGARPSWVGDLGSTDFRPDAPCATQKVPSLAAHTAAPDLRPTPQGGGP